MFLGQTTAFFLTNGGFLPTRVEKICSQNHLFYTKNAYLWKPKHSFNASRNMRKSLVFRVLLVVIFTITSLSAYGKIRHRYDVNYNTEVYEQPSKNSKVIGRITKGNDKIRTEYEIEPQYTTTGDWMKIPFDGGEGYVEGGALFYIGVMKTGEDADHYLAKWKAVSEKLGFFDLPQERQKEISKTAAALQAIAILLMLIAFALVRIIKGKSGWISALSLLTTASLIIAGEQIYFADQDFMGVWYYVSSSEAVSFMAPFLVALIAYVLMVYTLNGTNKSSGRDINWFVGMLISLAGAALLELDMRNYWYIDTEILIFTAIAQLLFCIHIAIKCKSFATSIPTIIAWLIISFVLLHWGFVICRLFGILAAIIACITLLMLLIGVANNLPGVAGLLVDAAGNVIGALKPRLTGGYVDEKGNRYRDAGRGKVRKER